MLEPDYGMYLSHTYLIFFFLAPSDHKISEKFVSHHLIGKMEANKERKDCKSFVWFNRLFQTFSELTKTR